MSQLSIARSVSRYRWVILALVLLAQCSSSFILSAPSPLAPLFQAEFGLSKAEVGLMASAASTGAWSMVLVGGLFTDRFGIRRAVTISLVVTGLMMFGMQFVASFPQAVALMFVAGLTRGAVFPSTTKAVLEWFSAQSRATAMGVKQMGFPISGVIAGMVLPALGLAVGWRLALGIPGLIIAAVGVAAALMYRDAPGATTMSHSRPADIGRALGDLLRNRALLVLCVIAFLLLLAQIALTSYMALYIHEVVLVETIPDAGERLVVAGTFLALCQVGGALGRVAWGFVSDRLFQRKRIVVLALISALSGVLALITGTVAQELPIPMLAVLVFLFGLASLGWNGVYNAVLTESVKREYAGTGIGLSMTFTEIGTISGAPIFGLIVDLSHSYQTGWLWIALVSATAMAVAIVGARGPLANR